MSSRQAIGTTKLRKQLVEPVFGIIKEQQAARRFLLRGLVNITAEWTGLATPFNLRTLWRVWRSRALSLLSHGPSPQPLRPAALDKSRRSYRSVIPVTHEPLLRQAPRDRFSGGKSRRQLSFLARWSRCEVVSEARRAAHSRENNRSTIRWR